MNEVHLEKKKVLVGVTGSINSIVSSYLLSKQNYQTYGVYLLFNNGIATEHEAYLKSISKILNIPIKIINIGTANSKDPSFIFKELDLLREEFGFDYIATGYNAKFDGDLYSSKYDKVLSLIPKMYLEKALFPLEGLRDEDIIKIFKAKSLPLGAFEIEDSKEEVTSVVEFNRCYLKNLNWFSKRRPGKPLLAYLKDSSGEFCKASLFYRNNESLYVELEGSEEVKTFKEPIIIYESSFERSKVLGAGHLEKSETKELNLEFY